MLYNTLILSVCFLQRFIFILCVSVFDYVRISVSCSHSGWGGHHRAADFPELVWQMTLSGHLGARKLSLGSLQERFLLTIKFSLQPLRILSKSKFCNLRLLFLFLALETKPLDRKMVHFREKCQWSQWVYLVLEVDNVYFNNWFFSGAEELAQRLAHQFLRKTRVRFLTPVPGIHIVHTCPHSETQKIDKSSIKLFFLER